MGAGSKNAVRSSRPFIAAYGDGPLAAKKADGIGQILWLLNTGGFDTIRLFQLTIVEVVSLQKSVSNQKNSSASSKPIDKMAEPVIGGIIRSVIQSKLEERVFELLDMPIGILPNDILQLIEIAENERFMDAHNALAQRALEEVKWNIECKQQNSSKPRNSNEALLEAFLEQPGNLELIEAGLKYISRQDRIRSGRLDINALDANGQPVLLELKMEKYRPSEVSHQLRKYLGDRSDARLIFVAPYIHPAVFFDTKEHVTNNRLKFIQVEKIDNGNSYRFLAVNEDYFRLPTNSKKRRKKSPETICLDSPLVFTKPTQSGLKRLAKHSPCEPMGEIAANDAEKVSTDFVLKCSSQQLSLLNGIFAHAIGSHCAIELNTFGANVFSFGKKSKDDILRFFSDNGGVLQGNHIDKTFFVEKCVKSREELSQLNSKLVKALQDYGDLNDTYENKVSGQIQYLERIQKDYFKLLAPYDLPNSMAKAALFSARSSYAAVASHNFKYRDENEIESQIAALVLGPYNIQRCWLMEYIERAKVFRDISVESADYYLDYPPPDEERAKELYSAMGLTTPECDLQAFNHYIQIDRISSHIIIDAAELLDHNEKWYKFVNRLRHECIFDIGLLEPVEITQGHYRDLVNLCNARAFRNDLVLASEIDASVARWPTAYQLIEEIEGSESYDFQGLLPLLYQIHLGNTGAFAGSLDIFCGAPPGAIAVYLQNEDKQKAYKSIRGTYQGMLKSVTSCKKSAEEAIEQVKSFFLGTTGATQSKVEFINTVATYANPPIYQTLEIFIRNKLIRAEQLLDASPDLAIAYIACFPKDLLGGGLSAQEILRSDLNFYNAIIEKGVRPKISAPATQSAVVNKNPDPPTITRQESLLKTLMGSASNSSFSGKMRVSMLNLISSLNLDTYNDSAWEAFSTEFNRLKLPAKMSSTSRLDEAHFELFVQKLAKRCGHHTKLPTKKEFSELYNQELEVQRGNKRE